MRKQLCLGFAVLILCLAACGKKETSDKKETQLPVEEIESEIKEQETLGESTNSENRTVRTMGDSSIEAQLQLFIDKRDSWYKEEYGSVMGLRMTFTDLDLNGRIEMILAENANTGQYTTSYIYEVNENYNDVTEIKYRMAGKDDSYLEPDIIEDCTRVYKMNGEIYYLYDDFVRSGFSYHACVRQLLCKRGNYIDVENLAILEANYEQLSEEEYGYSIQIRDIADDPMDLDTYRHIDELVFDDATPYLATFSWYLMLAGDREEFDLYMDAITLDEMLELYAEFGIGEGELQENHYYDPEQLEEPYEIQNGQQTL